MPAEKPHVFDREEPDRVVYCRPYQSTFEYEADAFVRFVLAPVIEQVKWDRQAVVANGRCTLEVCTFDVFTGAKVEVSLADARGSLGVAEGQVHAPNGRSGKARLELYLDPKAKAEATRAGGTALPRRPEGRLSAKVRLPEDEGHPHFRDDASQPTVLAVRPAVRVEKVQFLKENERKVVEQVRAGRPVRLQAQTSGVPRGSLPEGTPARVRLFAMDPERRADGRPRAADELIRQFQTRVKGPVGKRGVELVWTPTVEQVAQIEDAQASRESFWSRRTLAEQEGVEYAAPQVYAVVEVHGARGTTLDEGSRGGSGPLAVRDDVELYYRYQNGAPVEKAPFTAEMPDGSTKEGTLDAEGRAFLEDVPPGRLRVRYGEDARDWQPRKKTDGDTSNPRFRSEEAAEASLLGGGPMLASAGSDEAALRAAAGSRHTDAPSSEGGLLDYLWGILLGDFKEDPSTGQVVSGAIVTMIPVVDQIADVRDIVANLYKLSDEDGRANQWNWLALVATLVGLVPVFGSAIKGVFKVVLRGMRRGGGAARDTIFAVLRKLGRGDPQQFVDAHLDVGVLTREAKDAFRSVMGKVQGFFEVLRDSWLVTNRVSEGAGRILEQLREVERMAGRKIEEGVRRLKRELDEALGRGSADKVEDGTTGGQMRSRTDEADPPDLDEDRMYMRQRPPDELEPGAVRGRAPVDPPRAPRLPDGWDESYDLSKGKQEDALKSFAETPEPEVLPEGTKIYRVVGRDSDPGGPYWSLEPPPATEAEWRAGSAVKDKWNPDGAYVEHTVGPGGLKVWKGKAAPQGIKNHEGMILPGGDVQVWMPRGTVPRSSLSPKPTPWNPNF